MNSRKTFFIAIISMCFLGASCYYQQSFYSGKISKRARYVAVIPFVNLTSYPDAGRIVFEFITTECYSIPDFKLMDTTEVLSRLREGNEDIEDILEKTNALRIARKLGVDTLIYGSVTEFRYKRGLSEDPVVGITLKMLDVPTERVIWSGSRSDTGGCMWFCEDSLSRLAQKICHELVMKMARHL